MAIDFSFITAIGMAAALVLGKILKTNPAVNNKLIPWATLLVSILTQVFEVKPAMAGLSFGSILHSPLLAQILFQWFATTGVHSAAKNITQK